eukprot:scaffold1665_cov270-Alexandrium_tamarense.AAC.3
MAAVQYTSVLPHEPLPSTNDGFGHVHLQGAFVPKSKETPPTKKQHHHQSNGDGAAAAADGRRMSDEQRKQSVQKQEAACSCPCSNPRQIEQTLLGNLKLLSSRLGLSEEDILCVTALRDDNTSAATGGVGSSTKEEATQRQAVVSKVRVKLSSPTKARKLTYRLRRWGVSPRDLMLVHTVAMHGGGGGVENVAKRSSVLGVGEEGSCPFATAGAGGGRGTGCTARYGGRPLQVSQITPVFNNALGDNTQREEGEEDNVTTRWERAAPPKFRRLISTTTFSSSATTKKSNSAFGGGQLNTNRLNEEELEYRRGNTRFVYVENVIDGDGFGLEDVKLSHSDGDGGRNEMDRRLKQGLVSVLKGEAMDSTNSNATTVHDVKDDIRHVFQEALRSALSSFDTTNQGVELFIQSVPTFSKKKAKKKGGNSNSANGDKTDSSGSAGVFSQLHVGMRNNGDATQLIRSLQGKHLDLEMDLPSLLVSQYGGGEDTSIRATVTTGKLFLDYADILLPKKSGNAGTDEEALSSRSECTSTTSHIHVPGLHVLPDFVSEEEEQIMLAVLTGPHAPWAPPQFTPSGGQIRRRVQHYGYVFDYKSSDVLRRDEADEEGKERSSCPPLPAVNPTEHGTVGEMTNDDIEEWIARKVNDVQGWETLAGVIERTRRHDFSSCFENDAKLLEEHVSVGQSEEKAEKLSLDLENGVTVSEKNNSVVGGVSTNGNFKGCRGEQQGTYPNINQLTVNEYTPGQGIGSHVDTLTAFDDGLLIITLHGGIVMEFRKVPTSSEEDNKEDMIKKLVYLPPRSLVLLSHDGRYKWEHMIVSRATDTVNGTILPRKLRVSLTLRTALAAPKENVQSAPPLPRFESKTFPPRWGQPCDSSTKTANNQNTSTERSDLITPDTESKHVHAVYDAIATQWHHTRGKRGVLWAGATQFLEHLPPGSLEADVGCGDGKYFSAILGANSYVLGTDISEPLLRTAAITRGGNEGKSNMTVEGPQYQLLPEEKHALTTNPATAVADCIHLPIRTGSCDAAICIAVMHHLSTEGRRIRCLSELARIVKVGGLINVQAWALEQENDSKRKFHGTDVLVPFNAQPKYLQASTQKDEESNPQNKYVAETKGKGVAEMLSEAYDGAEFDCKKNLVVFQRYCHMYRRGELEELVTKVPGLELLESAYEKGNHGVLLRVVDS